MLCDFRVIKFDFILQKSELVKANERPKIHRLIFRAFHLVPHRGFLKKIRSGGRSFSYWDIEKWARKPILGVPILQ
jgi:hypothetical protein